VIDLSGIKAQIADPDCWQLSPLPLTDPRDAVARHMLNIPYRIIW